MNVDLQFRIIDHSARHKWYGRGTIFEKLKFGDNRINHFYIIYIKIIFLVLFLTSNIIPPQK